MVESQQRFAGKPAVFLDRDGVINASPGEHDYVRRAEDFVMLPGVPQAVRILNDAGLPVMVISNQRGVARGLMSEDDLTGITERMKRELASAGAFLSGVYYCRHDKDSCTCRKPLPGLFHLAQKESGVDLANSYFIGDTQTDIVAGHAAGCTAFLVLSGKTDAEAAKTLSPQPDYIATDLVEAARHILKLAAEKDASNGR